MGRDTTRARLFRQLEGGRVQCRLCSHYCVVDDGETGRCGVRANRGGVLRTLVYDRVAALAVDPVEKKPLFHFLPGTLTLSFATQGCNLGCDFCQNHSLSQPPRGGREPMGQAATPDELVEAAGRRGCASISYTYSEPTVFFELMQDTARAGVDAGLRNIMVSNGFMSRECLGELGPLMHAANIDLKSYREEFYRDRCGAKLGPVLDNLVRIRELGWWLEVTTLVIPGSNDSDEELKDIARFIARDLGPDVPWHVSRFHPDYRHTSAPPTPVATLERAWAIGEAEGLRYVYTGNVPGHDAESTRCPSCGQVALARRGFSVAGGPPEGGACGHCGHLLAGVWE